MKENILEYKGYHTLVEFDASTGTLFGKIEGIKDLVTFETTDTTKVEEEFHLAVDDYLAFCEEIGQEPNKEYKGSFNIRINPNLHRAIALKASKEGVSLNAAVEKAIDEYVNNDVKDKIIDEKIDTKFKQLKNTSIYDYNKSSYFGHVACVGTVNGKRKEICN